MLAGNSAGVAPDISLTVVYLRWRGNSPSAARGVSHVLVLSRAGAGNLNKMMIRYVCAPEYIP